MSSFSSNLAPKLRISALKNAILDEKKNFSAQNAQKYSQVSKKSKIIKIGAEIEKLWQQRYQDVENMESYGRGGGDSDQFCCK